ncbi:MAG: hypothetical protein QM687_11260 [Ferruginibacter sp.]
MRKAALLTYLFSMFTCYGFTQSSARHFTVIRLGKKYSAALVEKAFSNADMCGYYLATKSNDIMLDDSTIVRLPPQTAFPQPNDISSDCFRPNDFRFVSVVWSISDSGVIIKKYLPNPKSANSRH